MEVIRREPQGRRGPGGPASSPHRGLSPDSGKTKGDGSFFTRSRVADTLYRDDHDVPGSTSRSLCSSHDAVCALLASTPIRDAHPPCTNSRIANLAKGVRRYHLATSSCSAASLQTECNHWHPRSTQLSYSKTSCGITAAGAIPAASTRCVANPVISMVWVYWGRGLVSRRFRLPTTLASVLELRKTRAARRLMPICWCRLDPPMRPSCA
jgi:hypothetical protein